MGPISQELLSRFVPNSQVRRVLSLTRSTLMSRSKVKGRGHQGQKMRSAALHAVYVWWDTFSSSLLWLCYLLIIQLILQYKPCGNNALLCKHTCVRLCACTSVCLHVCTCLEWCWLARQSANHKVLVLSNRDVNSWSSAWHTESAHQLWAAGSHTDHPATLW